MNQHSVDASRRTVVSRREEDHKKMKNSPGRGSQENEEIEVGRITVREGLHVPGEGVPLIKDATYDMARGDVNIFGKTQCSKLHGVLEPRVCVE